MLCIYLYTFFSFNDGYLAVCPTMEHLTSGMSNPQRGVVGEIC